MLPMPSFRISIVIRSIILKVFGFVYNIDIFYFSGFLLFGCWYIYFLNLFCGILFGGISLYGIGSNVIHDLLVREI
jgi:hypothetical protein